MTSDNQLFTQKFNQADFEKYCKAYLTDSFVRRDEELDNPNSSIFLEVRDFGEVPDLEDLRVIIVRLANQNASKITITKNIFRVLSDYGYGKALVVFYHSNDVVWRLSLISQTYIVNKKGKFQRQYSDAKRYSYLLGQGVQVQKTANKYLGRKFANWQNLLENFSVSKLSNDFYKEIKSHYESICGSVKLPGISTLENKKDFCLRLIGRLIFCWFLKAKGYIGSDILSVSKLIETSDYYHRVLEPLFFDTLNKKPEDRTSSIKDELKNVPYLNGGLFQPKAEDYLHLFEVDFADQINLLLTVPNESLEPIVKLFEEYHFTVDESTPDDQEVGIDPEMMGRIFENFILERSSTGSFYTPRPIVDYMIGTALRESLATKFEIIPQTKDQVIKWATMLTEGLQAVITLKPSSKVIIRIPNPKFCFSVNISAYLIAKIRGQLYATKDRSRQFVTCNPHKEITSEIWEQFLSGQFKVVNYFVPVPKQVQIQTYLCTLPKIGYVIEIDDQKFLLFFSILLDGSLQLDTFYRAYKDNKITKLCGAKTEESLIQLVRLMLEDKASDDAIESILSLYIDNKRTSEMLAHIKNKLKDSRVDAYLTIQINFADPRFSTIRETYSRIIPREINSVKKIFGDDIVVNYIESVLDNSYFSLVDQTKVRMIQYLESLKIIDPACGSGAFPMGISQRLTDIIHSLDPSRSIYSIKKHILENCIYGCDILPIAVEISRLRIWLSLVVDTPVNITPDLLPNLEFKFVCANSLVGIKKPEAGMILDDDIEKLELQLKELRKQTFWPGQDKSALSAKWQSLTDKIFELKIDRNSWNTGSTDLTDWQPFQNQSSKFFDPEWMFGVSDGFDIVLGNPPYVGEKGNKDTFEPLKQSKLGDQFYQGKMDLFYFFFHLGLDLVRSGGNTQLHNYQLLYHGHRRC